MCVWCGVVCVVWCGVCGVVWVLGGAVWCGCGMVCVVWDGVCDEVWCGVVVEFADSNGWHGDSCWLICHQLTPEKEWRMCCTLTDKSTRQVTCE